MASESPCRSFSAGVETGSRRSAFHARPARRKFHPRRKPPHFQTKDGRTGGRMAMTAARCCRRIESTFSKKLSIRSASFKEIRKSRSERRFKRSRMPVSSSRKSGVAGFQRIERVAAGVEARSPRSGSQETPRPIRVSEKAEAVSLPLGQLRQHQSHGKILFQIAGLSPIRRAGGTEPSAEARGVQN